MKTTITTDEEQELEEASTEATASGEGTPSGVSSLDSEVAEEEEDGNVRFDIVICDFDSAVYAAGFGCPEGSPESHALHNLKNIVEKVFDFTQPDAYTIYLSGSTNFRYEVATLKPYKGNRKDRKPEHFLALRQYLINNWGAEVTDGIEADDACAILHTEYLRKGLVPVTASIDKDLLQLEGWHFNVRKDKLTFVPELTAWRNFYLQVLQGDSVDNISGIPKVGPKKAAAILAGCKDKIAMETCVQKAYKEHFGKDWHKYLTEIGRLVYLQRTQGEVWAPMSLGTR